MAEPLAALFPYNLVMDPVRSKKLNISADSLMSRTSNGMDGFLLVDKPSGVTSHDVVAKVRSIIAKSLQLSARVPKVRVGHTGTLDPMATGLLILVVGNYTKKAQNFSKLDKTYKVKITLGAISSTGDAEGQIKPQSSAQPGKEQVEEALNRFTGSYEQTPPAYSAVKVGGQRAYSLARAGKLVALEPRTITIHSIKLVRYHYPNLWLITRVSSGTYVRSLAEDIGKYLGTGAFVANLRRLKVDKFYVKDAIRLLELDAAAIKRRMKHG